MSDLDRQVWEICYSESAQIWGWYFFGLYKAVAVEETEGKGSSGSKTKRGNQSNNCYVMCGYNEYEYKYKSITHSNKKLLLGFPFEWLRVSQLFHI